MSSTDGTVQHNFTLPAVSGPWIYSPGRDTISGWTAAYTGTPNILDADNGEGKGKMYFGTQTTNGTKVVLDFTGVRLYMCINPNGAKYRLVVDGAALEPETSSRFNDPQCREMGASATLSTDLLPHGSHKAELSVTEASESAEFMLFGGIITSNIDVGGTTSDALKEENVNDTDQRWVYKPARKKGDWDVTSFVGNAYRQNYYSNCQYGIGTTASFNFTGVHSLVLWGFLFQDTHHYSVEFDNRVFNADSSTSMWRAGSAPLFLQTGLDTSRNYTITYRNFNENVPECRSVNSLSRTCCAGIDRLQLFGANVTLPTMPLPWSKTSSASPTSSQTFIPPEPSGSDSFSAPLVAIIIGVLGGIIFLCLIALVLCWRWRRGRKRESGVRPVLLASEDASSLATHQDVVQPWVESLQDHVTAYQPPAAPIQGPSEGEKASQWAAKLLPPRTAAPSGAGNAASTSAAQMNIPSFGPPLRPADMNRILAYVAARMDSPQAAASGQSSLPPRYQ